MGRTEFHNESAGSEQVPEDMCTEVHSEQVKSDIWSRP
jgi:hypothetical protein